MVIIMLSHKTLCFMETPTSLFSLTEAAPKKKDLAKKKRASTWAPRPNPVAFEKAPQNFFTAPLITYQKPHPKLSAPGSTRWQIAVIYNLS